MHILDFKKWSCAAAASLSLSLRQAHLYEAEQLERACLAFVAAHMKQVCVEPSFGVLSAAWPAVLVKINAHLAGVQVAAAAPAIEAATAQRQQGTKRKRDGGGVAAETEVDEE